VSQIPVVQNGQMVGALEEITVMRALHQRLPAGTVKAGDIMARPLPSLDVTGLLEEVYRLLLAGNPAVVATREGSLAGIVTRSDLMNFYQRSKPSSE